MKPAQARNTANRVRQAVASDQLVASDPLQAIVDSTRTYIRQNPENAALWCLGIGFILGWKLKPW